MTTPKITHPTPQPIDLDELQTGGYLSEANRQFFHPLGLALAISRPDPDDDEPDRPPYRLAPRVQALGYYIQPVNP